MSCSYCGGSACRREGRQPALQLWVEEVSLQPWAAAWGLKGTAGPGTASSRTYLPSSLCSVLDVHKSNAGGLA